MIGNDIVDLKKASLESNWKRKGYLNKLFSKKEQYHVYSSDNAHQTVWRLWSMKESAYKIYAKESQKRIFNPRSFQCDILNDSEGKVTIQNKSYFTTSHLKENYLHTTSVLSTGKRIVTHCFTTNTKDCSMVSHICHENVKAIIANQQNVDQDKLIIKKDSIGAPYLYYNNKLLEVSFSIAHHGNYGAFVILES